MLVVSKISKCVLQRAVVTDDTFPNLKCESIETGCQYQLQY